MRGIVVALVVGSALVGALGACGGDGDGGDGGPAGDGAALSALLARIPAGDGGYVQVANWRAAREAARVDQPATDADGDDVIEYIRALEELGLHAASPYELAGRAVGLRDELGFSVVDLDASAAVGEPPDVAVVFAGRIDEGVVRATVEEDPDFADRLETAEVDGVEYWSWGDDDEIDVRNRSELRTIGESLRLAVVDDGPTLVVVLAYGDDDRAREAADALQARFDDGTSFATRQPWDELVRDAEVVTDGRLVVATGSIERPNLWLQIVLQRDALLAVS